eukprot:scaffold54321_cov18-Prasinocladus_malaysianus.AAC.1
MAIGKVVASWRCAARGGDWLTDEPLVGDKLASATRSIAAGGRPENGHRNASHHDTWLQIDDSKAELFYKSTAEMIVR